MKKIQLIRPPLDDWYKDNNQLAPLVAPPTQLAILAAALHRSGIKNVEIIDGLGKTLEYCFSKIDADFVGCTSKFSFYQNALEICRRAKEKGAITILGGPVVSGKGSDDYLMASNILHRQSAIDYIIRGNGEISLPMLIDGKDKKDIPNLVYRQGSEVVENKMSFAPLDLTFDFNDIVDFKPNPQSAAIVAGIRGCIKADKTGRCPWCCMIDKCRVMNPALVWQQIRLLKENYGYRFFWESGDSFIVGNYPEKLLAARPDDLADTCWRVYINPYQVNEKNIKTLVALNLMWVFLGVEDVDDEKLAALNRGYDRRQMEKAIALFEVLNPQPPIQFPFMFGLPGETESSAKRKIEYARHLVPRFNKVMLLASVPMPLPGTGFFEWVRHDPQARQMYSQYGDIDNDDQLNYRALVEIQTKLRTEVTLSQLFEFVRETKMIIPNQALTTSFFVPGQPY